MNLLEQIKEKARLAKFSISRLLNPQGGMRFPTTSKDLSKSTEIAQRESDLGYYDKQGSGIIQGEGFNELKNKLGLNYQDAQVEAWQRGLKLGDQSLAAAMGNNPAFADFDITGGLQSVGKKAGQKVAQNVIKPVTNNIIDNITSQAKKYKTADEFVKAQKDKFIKEQGFEPSEKALADWFEAKQIQPYIGIGGQNPEFFKNKPTLAEMPKSEISKRLEFTNDGKAIYYRGIPKDVETRGIRWGDFLSPDKGKALFYGKVERYELDPKYVYQLGDLEAVYLNPADKLKAPKPIPLSQLTDIWNKANAPKNIFEGFKDLSTKLVEDLKGKSTVNKSFIEQRLMSSDLNLKQVEKDLIRSKLVNYPDRLNVKDFAENIKTDLLPLKINKSGTKAGLDENMPGGFSEFGNYRYENITLTQELRGNVAKYAEHIYESPVKTSAGDVHFRNQTENYFGHTRVEDLADSSLDKALRKPGGTRRVIEVQCDLMQKGRIDMESKVRQIIPEEGVFGKKYKTLTDEYKKIENNEGLYGTQEKLQKLSRIKRQQEDILNEFNAPALELRQKEVNKLKQYNDPTAHYRMVREEVKLAAQDGKTKLQFPTGETAMKIEGLAGRGNDNFLHYEDSRGLVKSDIVYGQKFNDQRYRGNGSGNFIILDKTGDETFKAVQLKYDAPEILGEHNYGDFTKEYTNALKKYAKENSHLIEEFSIAEKIDTNNPIYKFYEKDLGKYLKSKYDAKLITDKQGVNWYELDIKPEWKNLPVEAFGHTDIQTLLSTGAILTAGGLVAALVKEKKQNGITNQTEPKSTVAATTTPETLSMPVFNENRIPKLDGVPLNEVKLPKETPETINKITITHGNQTWTVEKPKELEIANRIKFITDQIKPEWTNYLLKLANFEGVYNQKQRNYNYTKPILDENGKQVLNEKGKPKYDSISSRTKRQDLIDAGYSESVDRGIFQINNKAFPQITDQMADNLDFSILWAISLIEAGKQDKWAADKYGKVRPAKIKVE